MGYNFNLKKVLADGMNKLDKVRKAEAYLGMMGITVLQPDLWESAQFEMDQQLMLGQEWSHITLASRYIDLLHDRIKANSMRGRRD